MSSLMFKIMKPGATFYGVAYNEKKKKQHQAKLIHYGNFGHLHLGNENASKKELMKFLEQHSKRNDRIKLPQFHAVLSCKGNQYSHDELKDHALEILDKLGYAENPVLIYEHSDTANNHIHIISSRIDQQGRKINQVYEGKRANQVINQILNLDTGIEFSKNLADALKYSISNISQFTLLMEMKGYDYKISKDTIEFYKHGKRQGSMDKSSLINFIHIEGNDRNSPAFVRAMIYKFRKDHSPALHNRNESVYTTEKKKFQSELTDLLKERFGMEFIFFAAKGKDNPYGYTLVDHQNKIVYKGSEILNLSSLTWAAKADHVKPDNKNNSLTQPTQSLHTGSSSYPHKPEPNHISDSIMENILTDTQREIELDLQRQSDKGKRSRKKKDLF